MFKKHKNIKLKCKKIYINNFLEANLWKLFRNDHFYMIKLKFFLNTPIQVVCFKSLSLCQPTHLHNYFSTTMFFHFTAFLMLFFTSVHFKLSSLPPF